MDKTKQLRIINLFRIDIMRLFQRHKDGKINWDTVEEGVQGVIAKCFAAALTEKLETLQNVCAEAYQLVGMCGAPEKALDNLCAAAQGEPIPHESFLPVYEKDLELGKKLEAWRDFYAIHCMHVPFLNYGNTFDKLRKLGEIE